jgi:hypothetical protein
MVLSTSHPHPHQGEMALKAAATGVVVVMALTTAAAATAALSHGSTTLAMATLQLSSAMWMPQMATARQGGMGTSSGLKAATSRAATMAPGPMEPTSKAVAGQRKQCRDSYNLLSFGVRIREEMMRLHDLPSILAFLTLITLSDEKMCRLPFL